LIRILIKQSVDVSSVDERDIALVVKRFDADRVPTSS